MTWTLKVGIFFTFLLCVLVSWAEDSPHLHGKFVRSDLVTDDVSVSKNFYGQLFGWTFETYSDYATAYVNGHEVGSIVQRQRPSGDNKAKPRWIAFMSVQDVDLVQRRVVEAGGTVMLEASEQRQLGRLGVFADAEGAVFGAIHSSGGDPEDYIADMGSWIWIELFSHDARKAGAFYADIAGYEIWDYEPQSTDLKDRTNLLLASDGYARAAVTEFGKERAQSKAVWLPFIRVADVDLVLRKAQALGGSILVAPSAGMLNGNVAVLTDSRGAAIGIMKWDEDDSGEGDR